MSGVSVSLSIDLTEGQLETLKQLTGHKFLSADDMKAALLELLAAELDPPKVELGDCHTIIYTRPKHEGPETGFRHTFLARKERPRLVWNGRRIAFRGGSYRVTEATGIVDL